MNVRSILNLSIIFPVFNEEGNLSSTIDDALSVLFGLCSDGEIVLVDDGSADCSHSVIETYGKKYPQIRVVRHSANRGYGAALRSGFEASSEPLVFFTDSDGQFDLRDLAKLLPHVDSYDMVIGYRVARNDPWHRKLNSWIGNFLARMLFGIRVRDINCAFKIFHREFLDKIEIESDGALVNTEILAKARKLGCTMIEVPVNHYPRRHGTPTGANPKVILKTFWEFFRLWRKLR